MIKNVIKITLASVLAFTALAATACGDTHEHSFGDWTVKTAATCDADGVDVRKCACGEEETRVAEGGHVWSEWMYIQEPSCQAAGSKTRTCKRNAAHTETENLPLDPNAHAWRESIYESKPTCTQAGKQLFICNHNSSHREMKTVEATHSWGEWTLISSPTCTESGEKTHTCTSCGATEKQEIAPLGHIYDNGKCKCGHGPVFPRPDEKISYRNPLRKEDGIKGAGTDYERFQMEEGYYEIEIGTSGKVWLSFSTSFAGQYALYSLENKDNVTAKRYDASPQYIPSDYFSALVLDDGNFYSSVIAHNAYWTTSWTATYCLQGKRGATVKVRFARIADAPKDAQRINETIVPEQLKLEKAPNGAAGTLLREVDYSTKYYYDEKDGYYHTESGNIIYTSITKTGSRLFPDASLATIAAYGGSYILHYATTVEGDYVFKDYSWFLTNHGGLGYMDDNRNFVLNEGDPTLPCYQNYVNSDGLYPVNQELFEFLNLYVAAYPIVDMVGDSTAWLSNCYEYVNAVPGSEDFPHDVTETFEVTTKRSGYTYYKLTPATAGTYTISVSGESNSYVNVNGSAHNGEFSETIEIGEEGVIIYVGSLAYNQAVTFTITVTPVTE